MKVSCLDLVRMDVSGLLLFVGRIPFKIRKGWLLKQVKNSQVLFLRKYQWKATPLPGLWLVGTG
jgi:hypothetical protein